MGTFVFKAPPLLLSTDPGSKIRRVVDDGTLIRCDEQMKTLLEGYGPDQIANFDESSVSLNILGKYSWHRQQKDTIPRQANESNQKQRLTIGCIITQSGKKVNSSQLTLSTPAVTLFDCN